MGFRELIKKMQLYSGFSDSESQDALELMTEALAERLTEGERKDFASQLPQELKIIALSTTPIPKPRPDILNEFIEAQKIDEGHAKKQILSAWHVLKDAISEGEINDIKAQLPKATAAFLH